MAAIDNTILPARFLKLAWVLVIPGKIKCFNYNNVN